MPHDALCHQRSINRALADEPAPPTPDLCRLAARFSALQYVAAADRVPRWPWTDPEAVNQLVTLVRAVPGLLDRLERAEAALASALEDLEHRDEVSALDTLRSTGAAGEGRM